MPLERARARAAAEGLAIRVREADAEALPFPDGEFDVVLSTFGVMFTPRRERAAAELFRVCRPGGRIGLASWTPDSFVGRMLKVVGSYVPPVPGMASPLDWGSEAVIGKLVGPHAESIGIRRREFVFRYRSAEHWLDTFRTWYGPVHEAFATLDDAQGDALERDLIALAKEHNTSAAGALRVASGYLEVVAVARHDFR